jgi:hypothetical protein
MILSRDKLLRQCPKSLEIILTEQLLNPPLPRVERSDVFAEQESHGLFLLQQAMQCTISLL